MLCVSKPFIVMLEIEISVFMIRYKVKDVLSLANTVDAFKASLPVIVAIFNKVILTG